MIIKKKSDLLVQILLIPYIIYIFFYDLTDHIGGPILTYSLLVSPILMILPVHYLNNRGTFSRSIARLLSGWLILLLFVFGNNKAFARGDYFDSFRLAAVVFFTFFLAHFDGWLEFALKAMMAIGLVHVGATVIFYFSNDLYRLLILPLREFPPMGTVQGAEGYHAGLCSHYSLNGTYCAVQSVIFGSVCLCLAGRDKQFTRSKFLGLSGFLLSFAAVLLTTKRAHLMFVVLSLMMVFYFTNRKRRSNQIIRIACVFMSGLLIVSLLTYINSPLTATFKRFLPGGEDISNGRFEMWALAAILFLKNPLLGVGWLGYRYEYAANLYSGVGFYTDNAYRAKYMYLDTHNVYLQVLAETGIIGFTAFMAAVLGVLYVTIKLYQAYQRRRDSDSVFLSVSLGLQVFMLLYSLTGCCLNDITFLFYMLGCGFSYSLLRRDARRTDDDKNRDDNVSSCLQ